MLLVLCSSEITVTGFYPSRWKLIATVLLAPAVLSWASCYLHFPREPSSGKHEIMGQSLVYFLKNEFLMLWVAKKNWTRDPWRLKTRRQIKTIPNTLQFKTSFILFWPNSFQCMELGITKIGLGFQRNHRHDNAETHWFLLERMITGCSRGDPLAMCGRPEGLQMDQGSPLDGGKKCWDWGAATATSLRKSGVCIPLGTKGCAFKSKEKWSQGRERFFFTWSQERFESHLPHWFVDSSLFTVH